MPVGDDGDSRNHETRESKADRSPYERDRDRVLYSKAFRRLKGVAQVAHSQEAYQYHTRLMHSMKVSQVGRRLAQYLKRSAAVDAQGFELKPPVVATAALAHDLGHPPFGHAAEMELNKIITEEVDVEVGFEGNPQSLRIVSSVETDPRYTDDDNGQSLNLTRASLNGMLKYPWKYGQDVSGTDYDTTEKFGYYQEDEDLVNWIREESEPHVRSPEATLMDWADDVTYAVHDVADFYKTGLIPLHDILQETSEQSHFIDHFEDKFGDKSFTEGFEPTTFIDELKNRGLNDPQMERSYTGTRHADALLDRFRSQWIEEFLKVPKTVDICPPAEAKSKRPAVENGVDRSIIDIDPTRRAQVEFLKELTFYYVIDDRNLVTQQQGHRRIIRSLFELFLSSTKDSPTEPIITTDVKDGVVPQPFRDDLSEATHPKERVRTVADAITMMTEQQAVRLYNRVTGHELESIQENIW